MTDSPIYLDYTQAELDRNYDQSTLVNNLPDYIERWRQEVEHAKANIPCQLGISYGDNPDMVMDIYGVAEPGVGKPIVLNLHGGAWRRMSAATSASPARAFVDTGALFAVPDFSLAPTVRLDEMVRQCRDAVVFLHTHARRFGGDADRIYVIGHSSGGHLAAMVAQQEKVVNAFAVCSGIYDLEPVRLSARNEYLFLDAAAARRNSPMTLIGQNTPPAIIAWGTGELTEFQRQGRAFTDALRAQGVGVQSLCEPHLNHFDMFDQFADPSSGLFRETGELFALN